MNRNICIYQEFLTEAHKDRIRETARRTGFTPHFFNLDQFEEAKDCLQHCEVLYAHSADLLRAAPATLKWYCCSFAGVDLYCKDPGLFANPDCLLTNSNVYGVTIAEHVVMVTLMLLRRMPEYIEIVRGHGWSNQLPVRSIRDNEFTILGTGDIGRHVADRLRGMGAAKIVGLSRSGKPHPAFDEVYPISALDDVLPRTKILVMALPSTPETVHILNRERIALRHQRGPWHRSGPEGPGGGPEQRKAGRRRPGRDGPGASAPGRSSVGRPEHHSHPPRLRQHDPGLHLRRKRSPLLCRSGELRRRAPAGGTGGPEPGILSSPLGQASDIRKLFAKGVFP